MTDRQPNNGGGESADSNERLLRHIEGHAARSNPGDDCDGRSVQSVDTSDLLDMLEREVMNKKEGSGKVNNTNGGGGNGNGGGGVGGGGGGGGGAGGMDDFLSLLHSSEDGSGSDELRSLGAKNDNNNNSSSSSSNNNNGSGGGVGGGRRQSRRTGRAGYDSGNSLNSSFTSKLLGGNTDDDGGQARQKASDMADIAEAATPSGHPVGAAVSSNGSDSSTPQSQNSGSNNNSTNTNNGSNISNISSGLDGSFTNRIGLDGSTHGPTNRNAPLYGANPLRSRPSFDNPFRSNNYSSGSNTDRRSGGEKSRGSLSDYSYGADISGSDSAAAGANRQSQRHHGRLAAAGAGAAVGDDDGAPRDGKLPPRGQHHSVSFSIAEEQETTAHGGGGDDDTKVTNASRSNVTRSTGSSDAISTFSLGSLATGGTSKSATTKSSRDTRSSRSSGTGGGTRGSAATASTHSSNSTQERRRRRELLPVKQDSRSRKAGGSSHQGSSRGTNSFSGGSGSTFGGSAFSHHSSAGRRSRKKGQVSDASSGSGSTVTSRNLYQNSSRRGNRGTSVGGSSGSGSTFGGGSRGEDGGYGGNLHDRHPIRYPKRSGLYDHIEEGNENDDDDDDEAEDEGSPAADLPVSHVVRQEKKAKGKKIANEDDVGTSPNKRKDTPADSSNRGSKHSSKKSKGSSRESRDEDKNDNEEEAIDSFNDEDGLFLRVNKVRNEMLENSGGRSNRIDFVDGLIASSTRGKLNLDRIRGGGGSDGKGKGGGQSPQEEVSTEEASFLSDLLRKRRGGSVISTAGKTETSGRTTELSDTSSLTHNTNASSLTYANRHGRGRQSSGSDDDDTVVRAFRRFYYQGGELLPKTRKDWVVLFAMALLLSPMVHVVVVYIMACFGLGNMASNAGSSYYGAEMQYTNGPQHRQDSPNYASQELMSGAWAGSSQVMLGSRSALGEDVILIPDADWVELQISRSRAKQKRFFGKDDGPKPPQRLPLPTVIDPATSLVEGSDGVVLYSIAMPSPNIWSNPDAVKKANADLWDAIRRRLRPRPIDAWPCWNHNSLARFREDGFAVMYPYGAREKARRGVARLAREVGKEVVYEFVTLSETPLDSGGASVRGGDGTAGRAGSIRRVGKDGSALVIPILPGGRSDVMMRRTISTTDPFNGGLKKWEQGSSEEPAVVMRRVKDLPAEDELTMRAWEGPPLEDIMWDKIV